MKLADRISLDLMRYAQGGQDIIIPNYYLGMWEADVLRITRSGIVYEYEIKISRADFKRDFSKGYSFINGDSGHKHNAIAAGKHRINKFFFVVPAGLITPLEVPKQYGLIYYNTGKPWDLFTVVRGSKMLRPKFNVNYQDLAYTLAARESSLRNKTLYLGREIKELCHSLNKTRKQYADSIISTMEYTGASRKTI